MIIVVFKLLNLRNANILNFQNLSYNIKKLIKGFGNMINGFIFV